MKHISLVALLSLSSTIALGVNTSDIYIINQTSGDLNVGEQIYTKSGFAHADKQNVTRPGFVVKPGKKAKVAALDRDQSTYPDDVSSNKRSTYYDDKYATVKFTVNGAPFYFKSRWDRSGKTQSTKASRSATQEKPSLFPLSSKLTFDVAERTLPYTQPGVKIQSRYVFLKLYHDIDMIFNPNITVYQSGN